MRLATMATAALASRQPVDNLIGAAAGAARTTTLRVEGDFVTCTT